MEESTTETTTQETGVETTQLEEQHAEAVTTTDESTQATTNDETQSSGSDYTEWLSKKGIDPSSPEALSKVAEMARNAEKLMHDSTVKAADLSKQLESSPVQADTDNELVQQLFGEVTSMKRAQAVNDFKSEAKITPEQEQQMVSYLGDNPAMGQLVNAGYISLPQLQTLALGANTESIKSEGGKQALQQLANKQRASALPGNATTSDLKGEKGDAFLDALMGTN